MFKEGQLVKINKKEFIKYLADSDFSQYLIKEWVSVYSNIVFRISLIGTIGNNIWIKAYNIKNNELIDLPEYVFIPFIHDKSFINLKYYI